MLEITNWYFRNSCYLCWKSILAIFSSHVAQWDLTQWF